MGDWGGSTSCSRSAVVGASEGMLGAWVRTTEQRATATVGGRSVGCLPQSVLQVQARLISARACVLCE